MRFGNVALKAKNTPKILKVTPLPNYKLKLYYDTKQIRVLDVSCDIYGSWFGKLRDNEYFKTVHIINDGKGVEWAEGQDIAPHELYELSSEQS